MPILLGIDVSDSEDEVVAIGAGQFRRKSPGQGKDWLIDNDFAASGDDQGAHRRGTVSGTTKTQQSSKRRRAE